MLMKKMATALKTARRCGWSGIVEKLRTSYRIPLPQSPRGKWKANTVDEIQWWDRYSSETGLSRRLDPNRPLQPEIAALLPEGQEVVDILDVGAGPVTFLGKKLPGVTVRIAAVDPLSDKYDLMLKKYSITPLVPTEKLAAERLTSRFAPGSFDLVCARNSIDHSYDPERAILQMIAVLKPGCYVFLQHHPNEGENIQYRGLHQWNLSANERGEFVLGSKHSRVNLSRKYAGICRIECESRDHDEEDEQWLVTKILKIPQVERA